MKNIAKIILVSALGGALTLGAYKVFFEKPEVHTYFETQPNTARHTGLSPDAAEGFTAAAEKTVNSVVHVTTAVESRQTARSPLELFFGNPQGAQPRIQMGSGSGVIISSEGYIVTNNHVIENAKKIKVTLNSGLEYDAQVVGADPTTDIALIKLDAKDLPFLTFSNSDEVQLGEWVLAVGNPFNLTSTVTAGIVSAKSRSIGILNDRAAIESFIQTDAAVNPGNSGGALVNTSGELIGINSAISTHTGSYEGYSFAVPSNIVKKVVEDLLEFGTVQRAFIGVNISDITPRMVEELEIEQLSGVYVGGVAEDGAAREAGIRTGDVITAVNGRRVTKSNELQELIGRKRPGDQVKVTVDREGNEKEFMVRLRNSEGNTDVIKPEDLSYVNKLGAKFEPLSNNQKARLGITNGLVVKDLKAGILKSQGVPEGFIITHINRTPISSTQDIEAAVKGLSHRDPVVLQGYTPDGRAKYVAFGF